MVRIGSLTQLTKCRLVGLVKSTSAIIDWTRSNATCTGSLNYPKKWQCSVFHDSQLPSPKPTVHWLSDFWQTKHNWSINKYGRTSSATKWCCNIPILQFCEFINLLNIAYSSRRCATIALMSAWLRAMSCDISGVICVLFSAIKLGSINIDCNGWFSCIMHPTLEH